MKKFVIFGNDELSGKLVKAQKINNYLIIDVVKGTLSDCLK